MFKNFRNCYVYILEGKDGKFYTGITWNIRLRLLRHNGLLWGGGKYTKSRRPLFLVHLELYSNRKNASKREKEIKEMSHEEKKIIINKATKEDILSAI